MRERWPRWVYGSGTEPDYRFTFANERTFLAWIRTALALLAAGVALDTIELDLPSAAQAALAVLLVILGLCCAVISWVRWARAEQAMRHEEPLPTSLPSVFLTAGLVLVSLVVLAVWWPGR